MILAADAAAWPIILAAVIGGVMGFLGVLYATGVQYRARKTKAKEDERRQREQITSQNVSAQVDLTKDVLENWKDIVKSLGSQLSDLHAQVDALEERERKCQIELLNFRRRLLELEGHPAIQGKTGDQHVG